MQRATKHLEAVSRVAESRPAPGVGRRAWPGVAGVQIISEYARTWQALARASPNPLFLKVLRRAAVPANRSREFGRDGNRARPSKGPIDGDRFVRRGPRAGPENRAEGVAPRLASCGYYRGPGPDWRQCPRRTTFLSPSGHRDPRALRRHPTGPWRRGRQAGCRLRSWRKPLALDAKRKGQYVYHRLNRLDVFEIVTLALPFADEIPFVRHPGLRLPARHRPCQLSSGARRRRKPRILKSI